MRKLITFLIIVTTTLLLVSCGGGSNSKKVEIGETVEGSKLAVTFTELEKPTDDLGKGSYIMNKKEGHYEFTKDGYVNRLAHFTVKNIGKSDTSVNFDATLVYDGDYTFSSNKQWYYSKDTYLSDGKTKGAWVNTVPSIGAFDDAVECVYAFLIPEEVADGDKPLSIKVSFDGAEFTVDIR